MIKKKVICDQDNFDFNIYRHQSDIEVI